MTSALRPLLAPESVAIVGASPTPGKYGHTVLRYLRQAGYAGRIYPINPEGGEHDGLVYYRNLKDVPGGNALLWDVARRCLAADPRNRYPTVRDVLNALPS